MRISYASPTPPTTNEEEAAIYQRIEQRRHPRALSPLDLALLQAPPVADGWNSFLGAIRSKTTLDPQYLELAICRIAVLNGAAFEWAAHCPLALKAGVQPQLLEMVKLVNVAVGIGIGSGSGGKSEGGSEGEGHGWLEERTSGSGSGSEWEGVASEKQRIVLAYADAMTRNVRVDDVLFQRVKEVFGEREVVELTAAVAAYNCVSRFLVALNVGEMNGRVVAEWPVQ